MGAVVDQSVWRLVNEVDDPGFESRQEKEIPLFPKCPDRLWAPPSLILNGYPGCNLGVKRPGREVYHSPPSSDKVKNEWSYTSAPPISLRGVDSDNFTLFFSLYFFSKSPRYPLVGPINNLEAVVSSKVSVRNGHPDSTVIELVSLSL